MTATVTSISTRTFSTTHEGITETRKSATMSYTHAVWAFKAGTSEKQGVLRWSQSVDAAHSYAQTLANKGWTTAIEDVTVSHEAKARPAKAAKVAKAEVPAPAAKPAKVAKPAKPAKVAKAAKAEAPAEAVEVKLLPDGRVDHTGHDHVMSAWGRQQCRRATKSGRYAEAK